MKKIVTHDLKNPLNGIQFAAMMLTGKSDGTDPQSDLLHESIRDSANRAFGIIANLLDTRKLDEIKSQLRQQPVDLRENTTRALKNFEQHVRSKDIRLDFRSPQEEVIVLGENRTLLCCLENLISNAIKFSPTGADVIVHVHLDGPTGQFRIEDQGPGIREDEVDFLFRKFTRLSARPTAGEASTGPGLHIVHELVSAMQGSVDYAQSSLGGACFTMRLPLAVGWRSPS